MLSVTEKENEGFCRDRKKKINLHNSQKCITFAAAIRQGEVLEWLKRHAWKACNRQKRFAGSNPVLSAKMQQSPLNLSGLYLFNINCHDYFDYL